MFNRDEIERRLNSILFLRTLELIDERIKEIIKKSLITQDKPTTKTYGVVYAGVEYFNKRVTSASYLEKPLSYIQLEEEDMSALGAMHDMREMVYRDKILLSNIIKDLANSCENWKDVKYLFPDEALEFLVIGFTPKTDQISAKAHFFKKEDHYETKRENFISLIQRRQVDLLLLQNTF